MPTPTITTYSFQDLSGALAHPSVGAYTFNGEGTGSVRVEMSGENSAHEVASDGSVMVSKIIRMNGTMTLTVQQTSPLHKWLLALYNLLYHGDSVLWAQAAATLRNIVAGTGHIATGISFQRMAGTPYEAQGQNITWVFMCADIQTLPYA